MPLSSQRYPHHGESLEMRQAEWAVYTHITCPELIEAVGPRGGDPRELQASILTEARMDPISDNEKLQRILKMVALALICLISLAWLAVAFYIGNSIGLESGEVKGKKECASIIEKEFQEIRHKNKFVDVLPEKDFIQLQTLIKMYDKINPDAK